MAWYRCGGGGIPSSLKGDMNDVFNKKFGTVLQNYPPEDWPGTVNLMGPLPEKTVSGAVVTFADGADDVPLKSCAVTIAPTLTGFSSITVHHTDGQTPPVYSETYTAQLGRTIYGGTADIVNGTGSDGFGKAIFTGSETWQLYSNETFWYTTLQADNIKVQQSCTTSNGVVVRYQSTSGQLRVYISQNVGVVDTQTDMNALLSNGVSFAYPYATPEAFTFDPVPIDSRYGDNTIWSDDGDIEVTYRRDIDLALAQ